MKNLLLVTVFTMSTAPLIAQQAQNRDKAGAATDGSPAASDKLPGSTGAGEVASDHSPDERFIRKAGAAGQMEVKLAELANAKSSRDDIKALAATIMKDHTAANAELGKIAKSMGVDIPDAPAAGAHRKSAHSSNPADPAGGPPNNSAPHDPSKPGNSNKHVDLQDKTGPAFDTAFIQAMDQCHTEDIALFEKAKDLVKNPELKGFVEKTLPILISHAAALAAVSKKDPSRPDARTGSPSENPGSRAPGSSTPGSVNPGAGPRTPNDGGTVR